MQRIATCEHENCIVIFDFFEGKCPLCENKDDKKIIEEKESEIEELKNEIEILNDSIDELKTTIQDLENKE